jgi:hypothetical protein
VDSPRRVRTIQLVIVHAVAIVLHGDYRHSLAPREVTSTFAAGAVMLLSMMSASATAVEQLQGGACAWKLMVQPSAAGEANCAVIVSATADRDAP